VLNRQGAVLEEQGAALKTLYTMMRLDQNSHRSCPETPPTAILSGSIHDSIPTSRLFPLRWRVLDSDSDPAHRDGPGLHRWWTWGVMDSRNHWIISFGLHFTWKHTSGRPILSNFSDTC
jgi:hypothetical protein